MLRQEGEAAAWGSAFICHVLSLFTVLAPSFGNTASVFLASLTSAVPPLIPQLIALKSRSLLEADEVGLSSAYKLLILPQYCQVIWDMTVMGRSGYFVQGCPSFDSAVSHHYYQLTILCVYVVFLSGKPVEVSRQR